MERERLGAIWADWSCRQATFLAAIFNQFDDLLGSPDRTGPGEVLLTCVEVVDQLRDGDSFQTGVSNLQRTQEPLAPGQTARRQVPCFQCSERGRTSVKNLAPRS